jgi:hypothetical protein
MIFEQLLPVLLFDKLRTGHFDLLDKLGTGKLMTGCNSLMWTADKGGWAALSLWSYAFILKH